MRFCNQGWHAAPVAHFGHSRKNCGPCRVRANSREARARGSAVERRRGLPTSGEARYTWLARSQNKKLGAIPAVIASAESCPPTCSWYGKGCFAEFHLLAHWWRETGKKGITFEALLGKVRALPAGTLWRYAIAGDLPGVALELDMSKLAAMTTANRGKRGFTYTHKPLLGIGERRAIHAANSRGFTVNLSADDLDEADELATLGIGPVVVVLPADARGDIRTPDGRRVVVCPAETKGLSCDRCRLCAVPNRKGIVGFLAHGQMSKTVSERARRLLPVLQ